MIAQERGRLADAEACYLQALAVKKQFGLKPSYAVTCHQLGWLGQERGRPDEAESWYRQALAVETELGDRISMAKTLSQLGLLARDRGDLPGSLRWVIKSETLYPEVPAMSAGSPRLVWLCERMGIDAIEACWREVTGGPIPPEVRDSLLSGTS